MSEVIQLLNAAAEQEIQSGLPRSADILVYRERVSVSGVSDFLRGFRAGWRMKE